MIIHAVDLHTVRNRSYLFCVELNVLAFLVSHFSDDWLVKFSVLPCSSEKALVTGVDEKLRA